MNSGREDEIIDVFRKWLIRQGWDVQTQVAWVDVVAQRGEEQLIGEAKGVTTEPGLDVDTMYGQLLRRMSDEPGTRYAIIMPGRVIPTASRVSESIRRRLNIDMYGVDVDDVVPYLNRHLESSRAFPPSLPPTSSTGAGWRESRTPLGDALAAHRTKLSVAITRLRMRRHC